MDQLSDAAVDHEALSIFGEPTHGTQTYETWTKYFAYVAKGVPVPGQKASWCRYFLGKANEINYEKPVQWATWDAFFTRSVKKKIFSVKKMQVKKVNKAVKQQMEIENNKLGLDTMERPKQMTKRQARAEKKRGTTTVVTTEDDSANATVREDPFLQKDKNGVFLCRPVGPILDQHKLPRPKLNRNEQFTCPLTTRTKCAGQCFENEMRYYSHLRDAHNMNVDPSLLAFKEPKPKSIQPKRALIQGSQPQDQLAQPTLTSIQPEPVLTLCNPIRTERPIIQDSPTQLVQQLSPNIDSFACIDKDLFPDIVNDGNDQLVGAPATLEVDVDLTRLVAPEVAGPDSSVQPIYLGYHNYKCPIGGKKSCQKIFSDSKAALQHLKDSHKVSSSILHPLLVGAPAAPKIRFEVNKLTVREYDLQRTEESKTAIKATVPALTEKLENKQKELNAKESLINVFIKELETITAHPENYNRYAATGKTSQLKSEQDKLEVLSKAITTILNDLERAKAGGSELFPLEYDGEELKAMYGTQTRPQIMDDGKGEGKCALYALYSLLYSIASIDPDFRTETNIKMFMKATVELILDLIADKKIPDSLHFQPGDMELKNFSCHALRSLLPMHFHPYKFFEIRLANGSLANIDWLLRQQSGYFIVYGNRLPIEVATSDNEKYVGHFHFLAVNVPKKLIIDNKTGKQGFLRLSRATFGSVMPSVHTILGFYKLCNKKYLINF